MDPDNLPVSDPSSMSFGKERKAWKDIWGSGQGIGAVKQVVPAAELVARLKREYFAARDALVQDTAGMSRNAPKADVALAR